MAADTHYGSEAPSFVQEPTWWRLPLGDVEIADLRLRLERDALPFFARFETRDSILQSLRPLRGNTGAGMPNRIVCAILLVHRGETGEAKKMLAAQICEVANKGHTEMHPEYCRAFRFGQD